MIFTRKKDASLCVYIYLEMQTNKQMKTNKQKSKTKNHPLFSWFVRKVFKFSSFAGRSFWLEPFFLWAVRASSYTKINIHIMNSLSVSASWLFQFYKHLFFQEQEMFSKLSWKQVMLSVVVTFLRNKLQLRFLTSFFQWHFSHSSDRDSNYKDIQVGIQGFLKLTNCPGINDNEVGRLHFSPGTCLRKPVFRIGFPSQTFLARCSWCRVFLMERAVGLQPQILPSKKAPMQTWARLWTAQKVQRGGRF